MEKLNYKAQDRERILAYLTRQGGVVNVEELMAQSGAEPLRVYPLLFELRQEGLIEVVEEDEFGAPEKVEKLVPPAQ
ncbi:MAG: hypothetical protein ACI30I_12200 [Parabacteroides sp.]